MKPCPACREKIQDDALRCKHCGTDLDVMKCPWCAEVIEKEAKKCKHCKSYIDKVVCAACGKHVDVKEMSCKDCTTKVIEEEVVERWANERFKMRLRGWITSAIVIGIVVWVLLKFL